MVFLAYIVFNFHSDFSVTIACLLVNEYLMHNMKKKKKIEIPVPLFFLATLDLIWLNFCPKGHTHFTFFD